MKIVQYNEYIVGTVDTDGLVLWHQGVNNYSANAECVPMHFQLFMGQLLEVSELWFFFADFYNTIPQRILRRFVHS